MYDWEEITYDENDNEVIVEIMYDTEWDDGDSSTGCSSGYMINIESVTDVKTGKPYDYNDYQLRNWTETIQEQHN